ncbi:DUF2200 domain-containing protein [Streptococcus entericus]|uniref:DUF2200 domain-containing protein n=1 Tax=Streptococcus entericus TaxID=155680 RepID=UPI0003779DCB|nr:DUF2200 domain-containing protein [Streptococcus entericus]
MSRIYQMSFASVYQALVNKVERKGHAGADVARVTTWLTGYSIEEVSDFRQSEVTFGDFFRQAPAYHPDRTLITGKICGVQIEEITDPLMQEIRRLDKLVDWLAKGKTVEETLAKYTAEK